MYGWGDFIFFVLWLASVAYVVDSLMELFIKKKDD